MNIPTQQIDSDLVGTLVEVATPPTDPEGDPVLEVGRVRAVYLGNVPAAGSPGFRVGLRLVVQVEPTGDLDDVVAFSCRVIEPKF